MASLSHYSLFQTFSASVLFCFSVLCSALFLVLVLLCFSVLCFALLCFNVLCSVLFPWRQIVKEVVLIASNKTFLDSVLPGAKATVLIFFFHCLIILQAENKT